MNVNPDLIRKFLNGECDPVEAEIVAEYLQKHPHILNEIYNEAEWQAESGHDLPEEDWNRIWGEIKKERRSKFRVGKPLYAAAACLLALAGILYLMKSGNNTDNGTGAITIIDKIRHNDIVLTNSSDSTLRINTPDSTVIYLSGHSDITYNPATWVGQREISLKGEAVFHVAKDENRPFTVLCDRVSVKALGTVFLVNGDTKGDGIKVRLFEGKVVVKPNSNEQSTGMKNFENFLRPGQELVLADGKDEPYVHYFIKGKKKNVFVEKPAKVNEVPLTPSGWFEFNSQPVSDVFRTLEVLYGTRITYDHDAVKNMFFIGRFEPTDSVEDILQSIALLNNLQIEKKTKNHYVVFKPR